MCAHPVYQVRSIGAQSIVGEKHGIVICDTCRICGQLEDLRFEMNTQEADQGIVDPFIRASGADCDVHCSNVTLEIVRFLSKIRGKTEVVSAKAQRQSIHECIVDAMEQQSQVRFARHLHPDHIAVVFKRSDVDNTK